MLADRLHRSGNQVGGQTSQGRHHPRMGTDGSRYRMGATSEGGLMIETGWFAAWIAEDPHPDASAWPELLEDAAKRWCADNGCTMLGMGEVTRVGSPPEDLVVKTRITVEHDDGFVIPFGASWSASR